MPPHLPPLPAEEQELASPGGRCEQPPQAAPALPSTLCRGSGSAKSPGFGLTASTQTSLGIFRIILHYLPGVLPCFPCQPAALPARTKVASGWKSSVQLWTRACLHKVWYSSHTHQSLERVSISDDPRACIHSFAMMHKLEGNPQLQQDTGSNPYKSNCICNIQAVPICYPDWEVYR